MSEDGDLTSNHPVAFNNYSMCVKRREYPSFTYSNLHIFPFLDCHRCSKSGQGICTDVLTSEEVSDMINVKLLSKRLCLVIARQQIKLPNFIFLINLVDDQLRVPNYFQHGDAGLEGEFQSYDQDLVFNCIF